MNLNIIEAFKTPIFLEQKNEWVNILNNLSDKYIDISKIELQKIIKEEHIKLNKDIGDHGYAYHSSNLSNDINFKEFIDYIILKSYDILNYIGYNLLNYNLFLNELWVQQFGEKGGGHHEGHVHHDSHISGFYFLKCSDKTSYPVFIDPRVAKIILDLPLKNEDDFTFGNKKIHLKPVPGTLVFFPSYLEHQFVVDHGIEPFRFIHFNIQAVRKNIKI
jgi:hypothetical protein